MDNALRRVAAWFYPERCFGCGGVCQTHEKHFCTRCASLPAFRREKHAIKPEFLKEAAAPFLARPEVDEAVRQMKYGARAWAVRPAAAFIAEMLEDRRGDFDVVTWIPMAPLEAIGRKNCVSRDLAEQLGACLKLPCSALLVKTRETEKQSSLPGEERRANVLNAFAVGRRADVRGKSVLIADDIITTGATVSEAARVLMTAGAREVTAVAVMLAGKH